MHKIVEKPEEHILNYINGSTVRGSKNVAIMRFALSRLLDQDSLIYDPGHILDHLGQHRERADRVCDAIFEKIKSIETGYVYLCQDNDVFAIARFKNQTDSGTFKDAYDSIAKCLNSGISETCILTPENIDRYIGIIKERQMKASLINAYIMMANHNLGRNMERLRQNRLRPLVIVADQEVENASFICKLIEKDFDVIKVKNGPEAIISYMKHAPDCVVLDLAPPGMCGMEVSVCLKAIDLNAHIVMMSIDAIEEQIIDSFNSGANDFLKKPFNQKRLTQAINKSPYLKGDNRQLEEMEEAEEVFLF